MIETTLLPILLYLYATWRKGLRRVWDLPYDTHNNLLPVLSDSIPTMDEICCRSVNFINNCLASDSHIVQSIAYRSIFFSRALSPLGRNAQFCCQRYGVSLFDLQCINAKLIKYWHFNQVDTELRSRVILLLELLFFKDESFFLPGLGLDSAEVAACINYLCRE